MKKLNRTGNRAEAIRARGGMSIFLLVFTILATMVTPALTDDDDHTVSCYLGSPVIGNYVGNVTVYTPDTAARACNILYYACKGKCTGCFSDFDLTEDVCYDNQGRRFLK
jgi:hypothetical protein